MDRRIDVGTLRTGLDEALAAVSHDTRVVIRKDGRNTFVLTRIEDGVPENGDWLAAFHADAKARGLDTMTMDKIDAEIDTYRREKAAGKA